MKENLIIFTGIILMLVIAYIILKLCNKFRTKVYKLFIIAETTLISGEKMDYVVNQIYDYLPTIVRIFTNQSLLRFIIQKMFDTVKDFLNDGKFNKNGDSYEL